MDNIKTELQGTVEDVVFSNEETGFTVIDMSVDGELITAVGVLPTLSAGETLRVTGHWDYHHSFGRQFKIDECERQMPKTSADMLKYLSSGTIKGIGPKIAAKIVEKFGEDTFNILENNPELLSTIKGISKDKALEMSEEFRRQFAIREVIIYLEKFGMTSNECVNVFKIFGARAIDIITENPYILCREPIGMSFDRADSIAANMSGDCYGTYRIKAGIVHIVRHNLRNGHTCIPRDKIIEPAVSLLESDDDTIESIIDELLEDKQLVCESIDGREFLFMPHIFAYERSAAQRLSVMLKFPPPKGKTSIKNRIKSLESKFEIKYEDKQKQAITTALETGMLILTGGPGTGKSATRFTVKQTKR
ncbi:MAG: hypothetical protein E7558_07640 [Ruminococcaceae bacterium]|nr:hypothetical protein [Oscillospiraceae bacterium]